MMSHERTGATQREAQLPALEVVLERLRMQPHPEGGYYAETFRSAGRVGQGALSQAHDRAVSERAWSTAIYYLLPRGARSRLHRLASDEAWHFYLGAPLTLVVLGAQDTGTAAVVAGGAEAAVVTLGHDLLSGQRPQAVVPGGLWFGAACDGPEPYSLVGCTVAPGFDYADFEMAGNSEALCRQFPVAAPWIRRLS